MTKILVIDDDPPLSNVIGKILHSRGYSVRVASNGLEGLRTFRTLHPDLVITDIAMPVKDGIDTIRLLLDWKPDLKIIAMSGGSANGEKDLLSKAIELGAHAVIAKPFSADQLLVLIADCLAD